MRLDKYLSACGFGTRSEVKRLIRSGAVRVGGCDKISAETKLNEESAEVYVDGVRAVYRRFVYLMLNKPSGYLSAVWDREKPVVTDLVPPEYAHFDVFPAGRLDIDTVGLMILTNDGGLAHRILSPKNHVPKTYIARVDGSVDDAEVNAFRFGMDLGDFTTKPAELDVISVSDGVSECRVTISEGKFHQIKRMFEKVGRRVIFLRRIAMNGLVLDESLREGELRELTDRELELLTNGK